MLSSLGLMEPIQRDSASVLKRLFVHCILGLVFHVSIVSDWRLPMQREGRMPRRFHPPQMTTNCERLESFQVCLICEWFCKVEPCSTTQYPTVPHRTPPPVPKREFFGTFFDLFGIRPHLQDPCRPLQNQNNKIPDLCNQPGASNT